jgi:O-antigen ligase
MSEVRFVFGNGYSKFISVWSALRMWLRNSSWFEITVILFIVGFLAAWSTRIHRDFFYFMVLLPFLIAMTCRDWLLLFSSRIIQCMSFLFIYLLMSMAWSDSLTLNFALNRLRYTFFILVFVAVLAWIVFHSSNFLKLLLYIIVPISIFIFIYSVYIFYGIHDFPGTRLENMIFYRNNPNLGSVGYLLVILLCIFNILESNDKLTKFLVWIGLSVGIAYLVLSQSRGLLLAFIVGMAIQLIYYRYKKLLIVIGIIIIGAVTVLEYNEFGVNGFIKRADSHRISIYISTIERVAASPIFGEGIATDIRVVNKKGEIFTHPHNVWLMVSLIGGLLGILLFSILIILLCYEAVKGVINRQKNSILYLSLLFAGLIMISFDSSDFIYRPRPHLWLGLWLPIGLLAGQELSLRSS